MAKVFIDGEAGTTGLGIRARLESVQGIDLIGIDSQLRKTESARLEAMGQADLVVLCLPDEAAKGAAAMVAGLGPNRPKVLDASSAHRVAKDWVYGFPELSASSAIEIAEAPMVSNPGCYATGAIALLRPLVEYGLLPSDYPVTINAVSGYSGGGKAMIEAHEAQHGPAFEIYGLGLSHKHVPEIMVHSGLIRRPIFVPSVAHFRQGMLVSIPVFLDQMNGATASGEVIEAFRTFYRGASRVRVQSANGVTHLAAAEKAGSDFMDLYVCANEAYGQIVLVAQLDNLGKGAAGAAVQNIGLMLGMQDRFLPEEELTHA